MLAFKKALLITAVIGGVFCALTFASLSPIPSDLMPKISPEDKRQILDRYGRILYSSFDGRMNFRDYVPLSMVDEILRKAFVMAEDKRFFAHHGVDWKARASAVWQNAKAGRVVRGASTITEQVVRILNPRPRNLWSRWIEGIEAVRLESRFSKEEILEFYLNEVPYAAERRGIVQAARYYFNRDLSTLSQAELLTLATIVRSPSRIGPQKSNARIQNSVRNLSEKMRTAGIISDTISSDSNLEITPPEKSSPYETYHFTEYVKSLAQKGEFIAGNQNIPTTLDLSLQQFVSRVLDGRLKDLKTRDANNGAVIVIDHVHNEILAWVNSGVHLKEKPDSFIDAIITPRQPGSALKPFVYALALEKGWTAATLIADEPFLKPVGTGLHSYRNYSRKYYGKVRLRDALANSLNVSAVITAGFVGVPDLFSVLRKLGFESLQKSPEFYGEGLALGNGEVSLLELASAYAVLARDGLKVPITAFKTTISGKGRPERVLKEESSSLISHILSDPIARRLEFGSSGVLTFPQLTAVKTGTSSDFRDIWALGFSGRYTVGVWMGNLDRSKTRELTGASGPALVLRSVFHELSKRGENSKLNFSQSLVSHRVCSLSGRLATAQCPFIDEVFDPSFTPQEECDQNHKDLVHGHHSQAKPSIMIPTPGLHVAMDPRIPDDKEAITLKLKESHDLQEVHWYVDGALFETKENENFSSLWPLSKGRHTVHAQVLRNNSVTFEQTEPVNFIVR